MSERGPIHPEIAAALRAYEIEIRDGTERSQQEAFRALLKAQQRALGGAAVAFTNRPESPDNPDTSGLEDPQPAAS